MIMTLGLAIALAVSQAAVASVSGVVFRSDSGEPLAHAQVELSSVSNNEEMARSRPKGPTLVVTTGSDGKFLLKDIVPGLYNLKARRNGYVEQPFGQRTRRGSSKPIQLIAGETMNDVVFRLVPTATISGRVLDLSGEPMAGVGVRLMRVMVDSGDRKDLWPEASTGTDDKGEYRLYWIKPGGYYLRASAEDYSQRHVLTDPNITATYYPGVADAATASMIELQPGIERTGVDIVMARASGHIVRGRIIDEATGQPPLAAYADLSPRQGAIIRELAVNASSFSRYTSSTGAFEIRNVSSGSYWLYAKDLNDGEDGNPGFAKRIPIEVPDEDIDDVVIVLPRGTSVPVEVRLDGMELSSVKDWDSLRVGLSAAEITPGYRASTELSADGLARIERVPPGEYSVDVKLPESAALHVKEILYGREEVLDKTFPLGERQPDTITVILSDKPGRIDGILRDSLGVRVSDGSVFLIPDFRTMKYKAADTDHAGHFVFNAVPPGSYRLVSWEAGDEEGVYFNEKNLSKYESQGVPVRIEESSKVSVDLKLIPAAK